MEQFAELYDQLSVYEVVPESVHYVTKFIDGLNPTVRVLVALQQSSDLDAAYELALLHESLTSSALQQGHSVKRQQYTQAVTSAKPATTKTAEDRRTNSDVQRKKLGEDKWEALRSYRTAKGLCFMCGEKWSRDHQCKQTVSLHVVQEMVEFFQCTSSEDLLTDEDEEVNLMALSEAAEGKSAHSKAFQLSVIIQGQHRTFLVDSGSTHSFVDTNSASTLTGVHKCTTMKVKVANGGIMSCDSYVPNCQWSVQGVQFEHDLRILPLSCYDGILGMDWLAKHSPMTVDWEQQWMSFPLQG